MNTKIVDHLFRHQYGKMIAILSNIFGLKHLELIEDAVQDTFVKAALQWRNQLPENPEAWLTQAAKNRTIDLLRQIQANKLRAEKINSGASSIHLNDIFLDHEVEDSQLRMIFVGCHPDLSREEQIAFSLKTISGFSMKEIAAALLIKEDTIKKRLIRARKKIIDNNIEFKYPEPNAIDDHLAGVLQVIYLIFNEGFHSTKPNQLINKELCGEALRLCKMLLKKERFRTGNSYALFALLCYHSSRLESKIGANNELIDLEHQDRSKWYFPLIKLGNDALNKALSIGSPSTYFYEAAVMAEHLKAEDFKGTNWDRIVELYNELYKLEPSVGHLLNMAIAHIHSNRLPDAKQLLEAIDPKKLEQRAYLYHGTWSEYYARTKSYNEAIIAMDNAINSVSNSMELEYLRRKKDFLEALN